jgi:hypothetical protein
LTRSGFGAAAGAKAGAGEGDPTNHFKTEPTDESLSGTWVEALFDPLAPGIKSSDSVLRPPSADEFVEFAAS